jgi:hypothetical protein
MSRIAVLYEDQLATSKPRSFGPHVLVLTCVADQLQRPREPLERHVDGHPCKGIGRLLAPCREPILADRHARVIAVCDDDRVREHLKLPAAACKMDVRGAIALSVGTSPLQAVLLVRNLETVLDAVQQVLGLGPLTSKPSPLQRDGVLLRLAYRGTPDQRLDLMRRVPSLAYLVDKLARAIVELGL